MRRVFVSYATADRRDSTAICEGIERRGAACWIASRDVKPGENYQEAIVRAIREACAVVLVFSDHANQSDEIKKELSLASKYRVPTIALRIADVEPSDAFAYELATRQWIDAFADRERSLDAVVERIRDLSADGVEAPSPVSPASRPRRWRPGRNGITAAIAVAALVLAAVIGGLVLWKHRSPPVAKSMEVRLIPFQRLSSDIPASMGDAIRDEVTTAFQDEGLVKTSEAATAPPGDGPAYALGGSILRDGNSIRVVTRIINERSGVALWSNTFTYDNAQLGHVPRRIAIDAGAVLRCGLFGASTYRKAVPDAALADYFQYCFQFGETDFEPTKALVAARRVTAAVPDFSWGWSAVVVAAARSTYVSPAGQRASLRSEAIDASATALKLDPTNSEAMAWKSLVIPPGDLAGRQALLAKAVAARPLYCGCEHGLYGDFLADTGRAADALVEYQRAVDMLALDGDSHGKLAVALAEAGQSEDGMPHLDQALDQLNDPGDRAWFATLFGLATRDYAKAAAAIDTSAAAVPAPARTAFVGALRVLATPGSGGRDGAIAALVAMPQAPGVSRITVALLGSLGANREALRLVEARAAALDYGARAWLFSPYMAGARADPQFAGVAQRLGLMRYWRTTGTKPDVCRVSQPAPFCRM